MIEAVAPDHWAKKGGSAFGRGGFEIGLEARGQHFRRSFLLETRSPHMLRANELGTFPWRSNDAKLRPKPGLNAKGPLRDLSGVVFFSARTMAAPR